MHSLRRDVLDYELRKKIEKNSGIKSFLFLIISSIWLTVDGALVSALKFTNVVVSVAVSSAHGAPRLSGAPTRVTWRPDPVTGRRLLLLATPAVTVSPPLGRCRRDSYGDERYHQQKLHDGNLYPRLFEPRWTLAN
jgi:hypothetical protein